MGSWRLLYFLPVIDLKCIFAQLEMIEQLMLPDDFIENLKNWTSQRMSWLDANLPLLLTITSNEPFKVNGLSVFPNPAREAIIIHTKKPVGKFEVRDMQGKLITTQQKGFNEKTSLDIRHYSDGLYLLRVWFGDGETQTIMVVK